MALILARRGISPPKEWYYPDRIENNYGETVKSWIEFNHLQTDLEW